MFNIQPFMNDSKMDDNKADLEADVNHQVELPCLQGP